MTYVKLFPGAVGTRLQTALYYGTPYYLRYHHSGEYTVSIQPDRVAPLIADPPSLLTPPLCTVDLFAKTEMYNLANQHISLKMLRVVGRGLGW